VLPAILGFPVDRDLHANQGLGTYHSPYQYRGLPRPASDLLECVPRQRAHRP
jgi:hypothetical protein